MKMQTNIFSIKYLRLVPLIGVLSIFAAAPVAAQEEPTDLQKLLGAAGIISLPKDPIDYQERAPLVVPPSAQLPPPAGADDVKRLNPEWPLDHDLKRARAEAKEEKTPNEIRRETFYGGRALRPDEISRAKPTKGTKSSDTAGGEANRSEERYSPERLGFKGWGQKQSFEPFKGEPDRSSLLEPPPGYRTPSSNAPYGVVEEQKNTARSSVFDRLDDSGTKK
jgi:hypothetical protein